VLDPVRIRFRSDNSFKADDAARLARGLKTVWNNPEELVGVEPAQPGDVWRSRWALSLDQKAAGMTEGPIAGYSICCPKCLAVHHWGTALNCEPKIPWSVTGTDGQVYTGTKCRHSGEGSCWNWTGSAEDGTLSASPSLHCIETAGGCGWHGHLTNGLLKHC
jgi:hypothetical protein